MPCPSLHRFGLHCGRLPSENVVFFLLLYWLVLLQAPCSSSQPISIHRTMKEELLPGTVVANLPSEPNFIKAVETSWNMSLAAKNSGSQLQYSILNSQKSPGFYFAVTKEYGLVSIKKSVDREVVCSFKVDCILNFEVAVLSTYSTFFLQVDFSINVTDINDNPPEFTQPRFELNMPENVETGKSFPLPTAFDRDTGPGNGVRDYMILQGEPFFGIRTAQTVLNTTDVFLILISSVNRESSPVYEVLVGAKDGGLPSLTGTLTVEVHISDINDNFPVFKHDPYVINIAEDTKMDHAFLQVEATDADTGPNGELVYSFSPLQPPDNLAFFRIEPATGKIFLSKSIDSRSGEEIELIVVASDKGSPPKVSKTKVLIQVDDTVNSMPQITVNSLGTMKGVSEVSEKADIGKVVAHVSVKDPDSGENGQTECSIIPPEFELVSLESDGSYKAVLRLPLDREKTDSYNVTVYCADKGFPSLRAEEGFIVKVLDENDQTPLFSQRIYKASLIENNKPGAFITQLKVTDDDIGQNAEIVFQVVGKNEKIFSVDDSGRMIALVSLDREESEKIIVTIRAMDKGAPPLSSSATVELTLIDVNDEAPDFSDSVYSLEVEEEQPAGKYVGIVSALDKDAGENSKLFYRFSPESRKENSFTITPDGGVIKTNIVLNRERKDIYEFVVEAVDRGIPPLTGTVRVVIRVTDINDNDPFFLYPKDGNNTVLIPHTMDKGTAIVNIIAEDADDGLNGKIMYSLNSINKSAPFSIDPVTGALRLAETLQPGDAGLYIMTVMATDKAQHQQRGTQTLFNIEVFFDNSTLIAATGEAGPTKEIITVIIVMVAVFLLAVAILFTIVCIRRRKAQRKTGMSTSASSSSTAKLHGGYYVSPGTRSSSSSVIATKHEERTLLPGDSLRTTNPYVVLIKEKHSGPAEVVKISRNGQAHGINDTLTVDPDQTDDGQFSTFKSQENILSPGVKYGSLNRKSNDNSSLVKRINDTYDDMSCDDSTSDSGRGGSDLEVNKEKARAQAATPISTKSGISSRLSPLPQEKEKTFVTFRGESPNSFRFDSDSDTLTRSTLRSRLTPVAMASTPTRRENNRQEPEESLLGRFTDFDGNSSLPRNRSLFPSQTYSGGLPNSYAGVQESTRQPQRIAPLNFYSPPPTCHQYDTETDQSDSGSNSNSLSRRNHIPRLPLYQGIEFTHHAYGNSNRNSIGGYNSNAGGSRWFNGGNFNTYQNASGTNFNYSNLYPSDYAGQDPVISNGYNNVVSELQMSRPVSTDEEFVLPPYPEDSEEGNEDIEDIAILPGYSATTPDQNEERTALFKSRYESSA